MELNIEPNNDIEVEIGKNPFWFDGPIGRFRYFVISFLGAIILLAVLFTKELIIPFLYACPVPMLTFLIGVILLYYWIFFVATSKRLYDFTGSLKNGIIIAIILSVINLFINWVMLLTMLLLIFIPGKMIKSNY